MTTSRNPGEADRRRNLDPNQNGLSSWHYGSQPSFREARTNSVAEVNKAGIAYVASPTAAGADQLLRYFHGYLMKYVDLLKHGVITREGKKVPSDTRKFLALFRTGGETGERAPMTMVEMKIIADRIPNAFMLLDTDDVYNELVVLFLELARRFNPEIGGFTGFIGYHLKYAIKQRMFQAQKDALNYQPLYEASLDDAPLSFEEEEEIAAEETDSYSDSTLELFEAIGLDRLNHSFVSSPPAHLEEALSKIQRKIIVLVLCDNMSFNQAAKTLNYGTAAKVKMEYDQAIATLQYIADNVQES
jgi:hypothetical protein